MMKSATVGCLLAWWIVTEVTSGQDEPARQPNDESAIIKYIAQGYRAHLDKFPFARVRMKMTEFAYAHSFEDGLVGDWLADPEPVESDVYWVRDGETSRYDVIYDSEVVARHTRKVGLFTHSSFASTKQLRNRSLELMYFPGEMAHLGPVGRLTDSGVNPFVTNTGGPLDEQIRSRDVQYDSDRELNGKRLPVLRIRLAEQVDCVWVDPDRGFMLVRVQTYLPPRETLRTVTVADDFINCSGDRWVPRRVCQVFQTQSVATGAMRFLVTEWKVLELDVDNRPDPKLLQIDVPPGTLVSNRLGGPDYVAAAGSISLGFFNDDGTLKEQGGAIHISQPPAHETETAVPTSHWPFSGPNFSYSWTVIFGGLGLAVAVVAVTVYVRRRQ